MKITLLTISLLLFSLGLSAQTSFGYDASGNRTSRTIVLPKSAPAKAKAKAKNQAQDSNAIAEENSQDDVLEMAENSGVSEDFCKQKPNEIYNDKLNESDVIIYPNPTQGALAVEIRNKNAGTPHDIRVFNANGAVVFEKSNVDSYTKIDLFNHPKGVYLLMISASDALITWKIIKE